MASFGMIGSLLATYLIERQYNIEFISYILKIVGIALFTAFGFIPKYNYSYWIISALLGFTVLTVIPLGLEIAMNKT